MPVSPPTLRRLRGSALSAPLLALAACASAPTTPPPCTPAWNQQVEARLNSGDGQGHGPDIGSLEWRSVVEFKLGLRGQPDRPPLDSSAWCEDIDQRLQPGR